MKLKFTKLNLSVLIVLFYSIVLVSCDKKDNADDCPNCPSVTGIFPNHAKGLDTIKIVGSNFADDFHSNIVKINGIVIHRILF
ncbi:MAG: IPT/TIG domain-containing protein [Bacteroidetes bacterium]|nr:IPT/TIG domain-containing protein [Bacteroidota bacterium]